jgi:hypothetical protein
MAQGEGRARPSYPPSACREFTAVLPNDDDAVLETEDLHSKGAIKWRLGHPDESAEIVEVRDGNSC